ncbi:MAG: hypothetical protein M3391_09130 [Actinomycetota bacterium]|nr:hypothetical protein [Actinomycetota bacterium]
MDLTSIAVFAMVILPGIGATLVAVRPGDVRLPTQLACVVGLGYALSALWASVLVLARVFSPTPFFIGLAVLTVAAWLVGLRRHGWRARAADIVREVKAEPLMLGVGLLVVLVLCGILWTTSAVTNFGVANPFRYWADALEIADAGRVPAHTLHWGESYVPTVSKNVLNSFNAAAGSLNGDALSVIDPLMKLAVLGGALGAWAVGRELGLRLTAPLMVVLSGIFVGLLWTADGFFGHNYGRMVGLCGLALGISAVNRPRMEVDGDTRQGGGLRWSVIVASGSCFAAAAGIHLIPTFVALSVLACYGLARAAVDRAIKQVALVGVTILAITAFGAAANLVLAGGDLGFQGAGDPESLEGRGGVFDATRFIGTGRAEQPPELQPDVRLERYGGWYDAPSDLYEDYAEGVLRFSPAPFFLWALPIAFAGLSALALWRWPDRVRAVPITALFFLILFFGVTLLHSYLFETYVPAHFPHRRLFYYCALPVLLIGLAALEWIFDAGRRIRSFVPVVAGASVAIVAATLILPGYVPPAAAEKSGFESLASIDWMRTELPCDARLLVGQRTGGTFQSLTGRTSITEGMAPYVRPDMLRDVVDLLLEARAFFRKPGEHRGLLSEREVDYVVVVKRRNAFDEGPLLRIADPEVFEGIDFLPLVHEDPVVNVYEVVPAPTGDAPRPSDFSGYRCEREPIGYGS